MVLELEDAFGPFGAARVFKVSEDPEDTPSPREPARPRAVAAASFSLSARDGRVAAASADLTSPAVARVVVAVRGQRRSRSAKTGRWSETLTGIERRSRNARSDDAST